MEKRRQATPEDGVLTRIGQAIMLHRAGDREEARNRLSALWHEIGPQGDAFHRCTLAHYMADTQDDPRDELDWDLRALEAAEGFVTERPAAPPRRPSSRRSPMVPAPATPSSRSGRSSPPSISISRPTTPPSTVRPMPVPSCGGRGRRSTPSPTANTARACGTRSTGSSCGSTGRRGTRRRASASGTAGLQPPQGTPTARLAPEPALRGLDGIAGRRPPAGTYASGTPGTTNAAQPREHE